MIRMAVATVLLLAMLGGIGARLTMASASTEDGTAQCIGSVTEAIRAYGAGDYATAYREASMARSCVTTNRQRLDCILMMSACRLPGHRAEVRELIDRALDYDGWSAEIRNELETLYRTRFFGHKFALRPPAPKWRFRGPVAVSCTPASRSTSSGCTSR